MQRMSVQSATRILLGAVRKVIVPIGILAVYVVFALLFSQHTPIYNPYSSAVGGETYYEYAAVLSIDEQTVSQSSGFAGLYTGRQVVTVRMESGQYRGRQFQVTNALNYDTNFLLHKGQRIVVSLSTSTGDKSIINVYMFTPDRTAPLLVLVGLFIAALCFVGGWRGFRSVLGIVFTLTSLVFIFVPLLMRGASAVSAVIVLVAATSCVTLFLVGGVSRKSLSAVLGTVIGVIVSAVILLIFSSVMQVSGYTLSDTDALLNIAGQSKLNVRDLLFAGIVISSLGAVMDIAISVATSVNEVLENRPGATFAELFRSGLNVGRDMMGTMANTLILAFIGGSVESFILMYSYQMRVNQMFNSNSIAITILEAISGSLAVILTVPIVSAISARLLPTGGAQQPQAALPDADTAKPETDTATRPQ